ncbi:MULTISPECIES: hypothetical protein [Mycobacterium]|uniref:Uncharacterized protein n=2 Tax=Mycobacterium gordonae TaxID=1778 RepID=A0A1X1WKT2_MYCGO|nr:MULTISPECIES: hypothetical protein [Mycobacterium]MCV7007556.1 hypothetical protein [Mycobacterium gordonae]ORV87205.1 hypothetical protein AWC08_23005 [Mycobacterium gordonae]
MCSLTFRGLSSEGASMSTLRNRVVTTEPGHASRHPLDASAKVYRRYQEAMKLDFKDLNFNVGMLPAERR